MGLCTIAFNSGFCYGSVRQPCQQMDNDENSSLNSLFPLDI